ncbi:MAG: XRE family transcriptional regulator [Spirochaetaceae bacterium]|nr:MAG: XRE family transcriptional regulator [Spirochaetaceae bacterium]
MQKKGPKNYPVDERRMANLGERLRLARLRRKLSTELVSRRAGFSRTTLYKIERGDPAVTIGAYLRVLSVYGLSADIDTIAVDDALGRRLQDLDLMPREGRS